MRSNYKRLGNYIEIVNKRNKKLEVETLLGVSIKKVMMPSIAREHSSAGTGSREVSRSMDDLGRNNR